MPSPQLRIASKLLGHLLWQGPSRELLDRMEDVQHAWDVAGALLQLSYASEPVVDDGSGSSDKMDFLRSNEPLQDEVVGEAIDEERRSGWLRAALHVLNERELKIIRERRLTDDGATLESLGTRLGISTERVRQIENRALEKLRAALVRENPDLAAAARRPLPVGDDLHLIARRQGGAGRQGVQ